MTVQQLLQNLLPVNGIQKRLTHTRIRHICRLDEYGLVGDRRTVYHFHILQRFHTLIILGRDHAHGLLRNVDLAGLQARIKLAAVHNADIQLVDLGSALPVIFIRRVGHIMIHIKICQVKRSADHIRLVEPGLGRQLILREGLDDVLRQRQEISGVGI